MATFFISLDKNYEKTTNSQEFRILCKNCEITLFLRKKLSDLVCQPGHSSQRWVGMPFR